MQFICGTCLRDIPDEYRNPTDHKEEFKITFGPLYANVNASGYYQMSECRQGPPQFWVDHEILSSVLRKGQVLTDELYPYYCFDEFCVSLVKSIQNGAYGAEADQIKLYRALTVFGQGLERHLKVTEGDLIRKPYSPYHVPADKLTDNMKKLADELLDVILKKYGKTN